MPKTMVLKPRMSEKTYALSNAEHTYVFEVPTTANKITVKGAVEAQFEVSVQEVRILISKGKSKRSVRKGGRAVSGKRADSKKAYVRLKAGDAIPVFAAIEEEEKKQQKRDEKAAKADKKKADK